MGTGLKEREEAAAQGGNDNFDEIMSNNFSGGDAQQFGYGAEDGQNPGYNPSDQAYNEQFNRKMPGENETGGDDDDEFNTIIANNFGKAPKGKKIDSHGDEINRNYNADDPTPDTGKNIDQAKSAEESGGPSLYSGSGNGSSGGGAISGAMSGKIGPSSSVAVILVIGIAGVGGGSMTLAGSLLINMKEIFHNDRSDATRTNRLFSRATIANKINNKKDCGGITIKCNMSYMSKDMFTKYKEQGFKIKGSVIDKDGKNTGESADDQKSKINDASSNDGSKVKVESIEYPDKTKATSGKEFFSHADTNIEARRAGEHGFASKASFYMNKFYASFLSKNYNFSKAKKAFPQDEKDKKAQDEAFNKQSGGMSDADAEKNKGKKAQELVDESTSKTKKNVKKGGGAVVAGARMLCTAYTLARVAEATVEVYHGIQVAKFALLFMQAADEIKDGRGDGPKTTYLANSLTYSESNKYGSDGKTANPKYNLSATDSEGYKIAALGDKSGLKDFSKMYMMGGGIGQKLNGFTGKIEGAADLAPGSSTGRQKMKTFCRTLNNGVVAAVSACVGVTAAIETLSSAAPGVGNIIGAGLAVGICACSLPGVDKTQQCKDMEKTVEFIQEKVIDFLKNSSFVKGAVESIVTNLNAGSDKKGVDAGNIIAAGAGAYLSKGATGYGQRPAKKGKDGKNTEVSNFITYTQPLEEKYIALEKDDARQNPLDTTNQYSFAGTIVRSLNVAAMAPTSLYGNMTTLSSLFPASFRALLGQQPTAHADYNQPSTAADGDGGRYDNCKDNDNLNSIATDDGGLTADTYCSIVGISTKDELDSASDQAYNPNSNEVDKILDFMLNEKQGSDDTPSIDKDGKPQGYSEDGGSSAQKTQYAKYLTYCTDKRQAPWGAQFESYEEGSDDDQRWFSGDKCMDDTKMLHYFRMWTNYCLQEATMAGTLTCYTKETNAKKSSACANGGNEAIYTCALKYDNYRYLWGGGHGDVPNAQAWISDFNGGKYPEYTQILDCSGLVRMAYVEAMGVEDQAYTAPDGYNGSKNWEKISPEDAKQGDIITQPGHVAIVESYDPGQKVFKIFDAETSSGEKEDNIRHSVATLSSVVGAYRAKKG